MPVNKGGKHKMQRSHKKTGYYTQQFKRTERNKARVAQRRRDRAAFWKLHPVNV